MDIKSKIEDLACDFAEKLAVSSIELADKETESPIEALFLTAIRMHSLETMDAPEIKFVQKPKKLNEEDFVPDEDFMSMADERPGVIFVQSQFYIHKYRVDFMAVMNLGDNIMPSYLAIECDGHEWHEKTKEQAASDKRRDRYLMSRGVMVMRFAGSEVWADPIECVADVREFFANRKIVGENVDGNCEKAYSKGHTNGYAFGHREGHSAAVKKYGIDVLAHIGKAAKV